MVGSSKGASRRKLCRELFALRHPRHILEVMAASGERTSLLGGVSGGGSAASAGGPSSGDKSGPDRSLRIYLCAIPPSVCGLALGICSLGVTWQTAALMLVASGWLRVTADIVSLVSRHTLRTTTSRLPRCTSRLPRCPRIFLERAVACHLERCFADGVMHPARCAVSLLLVTRLQTISLPPPQDYVLLDSHGLTYSSRSQGLLQPRLHSHASLREQNSAVSGFVHPRRKVFNWKCCPPHSRHGSHGRRNVSLSRRASHISSWFWYNLGGLVRTPNFTADLRLV